MICNDCDDSDDDGGDNGDDDDNDSVQNSATFPTLLLKSSKKVVFLIEISSK